MRPESETLLNTLLTQLAERIVSDREAVEERFKTVHEDARRDRREVIGQIERLKDELVEATKIGFAALEARVIEVCDRGGVEHGVMRADNESTRKIVDGLVEWKRAMEAKAEGRAEVIDDAKGRVAYFSQYWLPLILAALAALSWFKDDLPSVSIGPAHRALPR